MRGFGLDDPTVLLHSADAVGSPRGAARRSSSIDTPQNNKAARDYMSDRGKIAAGNCHTALEKILQRQNPLAR